MVTSNTSNVWPSVRFRYAALASNTKIVWKALYYNMEKTCCMCKHLLDVSCFKSNKKRKDGLQSQCIKCQCEYRRKHYLENKQKYVDKSCSYKKEFMRWWKEYKKQFKCEECGEDHPACIDFHHHKGNKEKSVSEFITNVCKEKALKEIAKCIPLCSNCHRKKHWAE